MNAHSEKDPVVSVLHDILGIVVFCITLVVVGGAVAAWLMLS